jgi:hypothetical protein
MTSDYTRYYIDAYNTQRYEDDDGLPHRLDGPAIIYAGGDQMWWFHGLKHRIGGPATTMASGIMFWWEYGQRHRLDGPACQYGWHNEWYYRGQQLSHVHSQAEFERYLKLKAFW